MMRNWHVRTLAQGTGVRLLIGLLLTVGLLLPGSTVVADEPVPPSGPGEPPVWQVPPAGTLVETGEVAATSVGNPKLGASLNQLLDVHRRAGLMEAQTFATAHAMVLEDDRVQVVAVMAQEVISDVKAAVETLGGEYQLHYEGLLQALIPIDALESLAERPDVQLVREPLRPVLLELPQVGSKTTEGVAASNASAWHTAGYTGSGVRVGVIDGGFTDYADLLGTDLPSSVNTHDWTGTGIGGSDHGTACAEIVYDMAYGITMDLHKISTDVEFGNAVNRAIADGVDVLSASLGWTINGPGDGTGSLADIVNTARSNGIFFAVAAGNNAQENWAGTYVNSGTSNRHAWDGASEWYNFLGPGDGTCYVYTAGSPISAGLHWDDWTAVNQDYDLHLYRWPGAGGLILVTSSTDAQNGGPGQTPEEFIYTTAAGGNCYAWAVERVSATRDVCLRLAAPKMGHLDEWTPTRSLSFPADSPDAITVGAVDVSSPYNLESYSSRGPTFGSGGACTGGATKPDISAYANVSTVAYGDGVFNGTSAATPHVAGAAALVKQAYPSYTVAQMQSFLEGRAYDLGTSGKDNLYGFGRLHLGTPPAMSGLQVTSITPNSSYPGQQVSITNLAGNDFQTGADVALIRGMDVISATNVVRESASKITCDFDLTGAAIGLWDVRVVNPGGESAELADGFAVGMRVYLPSTLKNYPPVGTDTLYATADAGVLQGASTTNFGSATDMWVGYDHCLGGQIGRGLVQFDLSSIPGTATINQATLYVRLVNSCDIGERTHTVTAYRTGSSWSESSVTWNSQPGIGEAYGSVAIPSRTWGWYALDVTDLVRAWMAGTYSNYGVMLRGPEGSGDDSARLGFYTSESSYDPYLEVTGVGVGASGLSVGEEGVSSVGEVPAADERGLSVKDLLGAFLGTPGYRPYGASD